MNWPQSQGFELQRRALVEEQIGAAFKKHFCFWLYNAGKRAEQRNGVNCCLSPPGAPGAMTPPAAEPKLRSSGCPG